MRLNQIVLCKSLPYTTIQGKYTISFGFLIRKMKTIMTFLNKSDNEVNEKLSMGECIHKGTIYPPTEMLSPS